LVLNLYCVEFFRVSVNELYKPTAGRLVIMVVDALRWDFVEGAKGRLNMPYTASLIDGKKACLLIGKARPPTVTMPRIKVGSKSVVSLIYIVRKFM
jgi:ethanolaminephosphotransferase